MTPKRVGWAAVALGILAFFVAVPPLTVRSPIVVIVLAALAMAAGSYAVTAGEKRIGWGGIVAGLVGLVGGYAATQSGVANLERVVVWGALGAATLRYATPLIFGAVGGLFSERSGVVNIALEGMMLMGAFFGAWGADMTGSWILGLVIAVVAGSAFAAIHALFAISFRADQIVSGTALNLLAVGITGYLYVQVYGDLGTPDDLPSVPNVSLPIDWLPLFGDVFGDLNLLVWLALAAVLVTWIVVFRTPTGLRLRSAGENPLAAETAGLNVVRTRYYAVMASGGLAALGGAFLSIGFLHTFTQNMTAGRGFIALAALIFGRWKPGLALAATLLFGFGSALASRLPVFSPSGAVLFQALPYVLTLIAVTGLIGRSVPPLALGRPLPRS
ncbi:ABC transporter permease [Solirubrobacter phytolaccae]|uniref:ABC transporter permease n=1 Tax=Solirubrobacter phytolaccae TaxID=1404360 RepID=A0A9X3SE06_9ACTN|nr:ABC transporter permease [Solirubrobacter phytolaccae]MDA0184310.1 ABC transporter permease [Solirubrobacter phytolaccae]